MEKKRLDAEIKFNIGGQAVIEGVMFRGRNYWSVAVRKEDGSIVSDTFPLNLKYQKSRISKLPFLRGFFVLLDSIYLGYRALEYAAKNAFEEDVGFEEKDFGLAGVVALVVAVVLFVLAPLYGARLLLGTQTQESGIVFSLLEGLLRVVIFVGYILAISLWEDVRRVFAYHGAEHMIIHAFEHEGTVDPDKASKYSPLHLSCGTSFIIFVLLIMIVFHAFIRGPFLVAFLIRLLLIPFVAGISYEIIRFARRHENLLIVKAISVPGLLIQKLTTRVPKKDQLEVASESLKALLDVERIEYETSSSQQGRY